MPRVYNGLIYTYLGIHFCKMFSTTSSQNSYTNFQKMVFKQTNKKAKTLTQNLLS